MPRNKSEQMIVNGFYLVGFFSKGQIAKFTVQVAKPFKADLNGETSGKCFTGLKRNTWASDWRFIENKKISDIDKDTELREEINEIWEEWCKKHKRKYSPIIELNEVGNSSHN